jgi:hypothetical protein
MPADETKPTIRELAHRSGDGLDVRLMWDTRDGRLTVAVSDRRLGRFFEVPAAPDAALHVFNHPYAHAA